LVAASAVLAVLTLASAPYTAACAEATLPAGDVVLLELPAPLVPLPAEPEPPEPDPPEPPPPDGAAGELLGAVVVVVGAAVAGFVVVVVWVLGFARWVAGLVCVVGFVGLVDVVVVAVGVVLARDTNSVVPEPELLFRLAVVAVELAVDAALVSAVLSWSWAAVRACSAWSNESCAEVESSVAISWPLVTC
jgi:hypothetical protein